MTNRLEARTAALAKAGGCGVAPYVTAGDGGLATTLAVLRALDAGGAACVELGLPFSDPIADGPVLQSAAQRALDTGTTLGGVLEVVRALREGGSELPVALFSYANPLVVRGWRESARRAAAAGVDAWLVPDLPVEEGGEMRDAALEHGLCPIFFAAPTSSDERITAAAAASRGFVYAVGRVGVTGRETELDQSTLDFLARVRRLSELPVAVGFGLRTSAQVAAVARHAELAIIGSALVQRLHEASVAAGGAPAAVADAAAIYLEELKAGVTA